MMDQQQTQQTEQIIAEMLEFLERSEDENDSDQQTTKDKCNGKPNSIKKDLNDSIATENIKENIKAKKKMKPISFIANELKKLRQQVQLNTQEIGFKTHQEVNSFADNHCGNETSVCLELDNLDWHYKLENHCRRSFSNIYTQEVYKVIYQDTTGHPTVGSMEYQQAAQNYVLYGKHFLDFPKNFQVLLNENSWQNCVAENSNLKTNFFNSSLYSKSNTITPNVTTTPVNGSSAAAAAAAAPAYYQICNNMQAQTRSAMSTNPGNSSAYGIFLGNKVTYVAGTPTTPAFIYNQHNTTTTNFISNSLANAALATPPTMLYTNPLLTTTTQQYLMQFLSAAALSSNSVQSATVSNAGSGSVYERLMYAQMLQQQLYQTQLAAAAPSAKFQNKHRVLNPVARQTANVFNVSNNTSSIQNFTPLPLPCSSNGTTLNACNRPAKSASPTELSSLISQLPILTPIEASEHSKITSV